MRPSLALAALLCVAIVGVALPPSLAAQADDRPPASALELLELRLTLAGTGRCEDGDLYASYRDDLEGRIGGERTLVTLGSEEGMSGRLTRRLEIAHCAALCPDGACAGECTWTERVEGEAAVTLVEEALTISPIAERSRVETDRGGCPASVVVPEGTSTSRSLAVAGVGPSEPLRGGRSYRLDEGGEPVGTLRVLGVCEGSRSAGGDEEPRTALVRAPVAAALAAHGARAGPEVVAVRDTRDERVIRFHVRLGAGNEPLPVLACLKREAAAGRVAEGSLAGAGHLLVGGVQRVGSRTRVSMRVVVVETAEVVAQGMGDATGSDGAAVRRAATDAVRALGWPFAR